MADDDLAGPSSPTRVLPAPATTLAMLDAAILAPAELAAALRFAAAAIAHHHHAAGFDPPTANPAVREVLRGIRHTHGTAPAGKTPATAELVARMLAVCPDTLIGQRDRALIAGAFRRSELLTLEIA